MFRPPHFSLFASSLLAFATLAPALSGQALPENSPFVSAAAPVGNTPAAAGYEFAGMSVLGKNTLLGIKRASDSLSFWIPLGDTIGGITAVSYDAQTDVAVIRADGRVLTLPLHQGSIAPESPASFAATPVPPIATALVPAAGKPGAPLTAQQEKEMEARMLVTDLLEIGQRQRRAYAEAQRAAAEHAHPPAAPPPSPGQP